MPHKAHMNDSSGLSDRGNGLVYSPLRDAKGEIRLLQSLPSADNDELHYTLSTYKLEADTLPPFQAISYTWGDFHDEKTIWIDGEPVSVRNNCHYSLWQTSLHYEGPIWIDSICINQQDHHEKSSQVAIMARIFGSAMMVAACIGPQNEHSRLIFDKCRELERVELATHGAQRTLERWLASPKDIDTICESLEEFGNRKYWSRLWIVQELHVAPDIYFYCGEDRFHWNIMEKIRSLHEKVLFKDQTVVYASTATRWMDLFTILSRLGGIGTRGLLTRLWKLECEDKRDRVYGILHWIEKPPTCEPIVPDYDRSVIDVALEFMDYILISRTILHHARALLRALEIQSSMIPHPTSKSELCVLRTYGFERACRISMGASGRLTVPSLASKSIPGLQPADGDHVQSVCIRDTETIIAHAGADVREGDILLIESPFAICMRTQPGSTEVEWAGLVYLAADWLEAIKVPEPDAFTGVRLVDLTFEIQLTKEEMFLLAADDSECLGRMTANGLPSVGRKVQVGNIVHPPLMNDRDWVPYVEYFADHPDCQVTAYL